MKIAIADNCTLKFSKDIKEHWEKSHEVKYEIGASEFLAQWADIYFIDWWDNNIHYLFNWYKDHPEAKKPKFIVRAIDWDIWVRGIRSQELLNFVDKVICIAPHMLDWLNHEKDDRTGELIQWGNKLELIQPGVNLDKFTPKQKVTDGFQVGMVLGDMWWYKNHMGGLDIFATLAKKDSRWRLHIRGQHEAGQFNPMMFDHYLRSRDIQDKVTLYGPVNDMNEWYEGIDVLLHPGMKEAFCYAVAESLAKEIPVVINDFYGSDRIWADWMRYDTHERAVEMIELMVSGGSHSRSYVEKNYSLNKMLAAFDEVLESL